MDKKELLYRIVYSNYNRGMKIENLRKLVDILTSEEKLTITKVSYGLDVTYAHALNLIQDLEKLGIVKTKKVGRERIIQVV